MDMKCHTPQQQQQQQQQQQKNMLMNGNERMLTTSTTTTIPAPTQPTPTTAAAATMQTGTGITTATSLNGNTMTTAITTTNTKMPPTTNDRAMCGKNGNTTIPQTIVNGSCNNHNSNSPTNDSNNNSHKNNNNNNNNSNNLQTNSTCGPGPPQTSSASSAAAAAAPQSLLANAANTLSSTSGRVTLAEYNLNGGTICGNGNGSVNVAVLCAASNNNHNNMNGGLTLSLQQQQQQQLQLHALQMQQQHHQHSCTNINSHNTSASCINTDTTSSLSSSISSMSLHLPCHSISNGGSINARLAQHQHQRQQQQQCAYCCQPICDRYILRVVDTSFHESCLKCATCSLHLVQSCYVRDGKLYCRIDYERLFIRNRCLGCGHKIASDELVMRTLENVFHLKCFACVVCGALLKKGEQYVVKQGQLFCRFDYEKEVEMLQGYDFYGDDLFPPKMDGRRGPKRPRTILNTQQRRAFKASFEMSPKPCRKVRENLAKETGLSLRIVQVWFQNQRAKVKKIQKKAKQEHVKGASDSQDSQESDGSLAKIKDEAHSDSESLLESPFSSCGAGGGSSSDGVAKLRCVKDENDNAPFNCMETNKENCNKTNEPILNTILGLSYATFQQLMGPFTQTSMINPIDRLYSMQNSYFRPDDLSYGECGKEAMEN